MMVVWYDPHPFALLIAMNDKGKKKVSFFFVNAQFLLNGMYEKLPESNDLFCYVIESNAL